MAGTLKGTHQGGKVYREEYRGRKIAVDRLPGQRNWIWLDDRVGEGHTFGTRQEALNFARLRIDVYLSHTVAFIWSKKYQCYLGISLQSNHGGDFCNDVSARLTAFGTPHAFSERDARRTLEEDAPWYNSGPDWPMRDDYNLDNCNIVVIELTSNPE